MEQSARRQILADLGIVTWQLRVRAGAATAAGAEHRGADPGRPGEAAGETTPDVVEARAPVVAVPAPEPAVEPAPPVRRAAQPAVPPGTSTEHREAPWSVLSLVSGGALLLVDGEASRRDLRLAMDVLGAAAGDFSTRPASRRFDWPPPGAEQTVAAGTASESAGGRALLAFVGKDLADHGVRRVLCTAGPDARLPPLPDGVERVPVPELAALGQDPDAKRALWQLLKSRGA